MFLLASYSLVIIAVLFLFVKNFFQFFISFSFAQLTSCNCYRLSYLLFLVNSFFNFFSFLRYFYMSTIFLHFFIFLFEFNFLLIIFYSSASFSFFLSRNFTKKPLSIEEHSSSNMPFTIST